MKMITYLKNTNYDTKRNDRSACGGPSRMMGSAACRPERKTMNHELKTDPEVFCALIAGAKTYELLKDDRGFAVGDTLTLRETKHTDAEMAAGAPLEYTGRTHGKVVTHILRGPIYGLMDGWAILSCGARLTYPLADDWDGSHL